MGRTITEPIVLADAAVGACLLVAGIVVSAARRSASAGPAARILAGAGLLTPLLPGLVGVAAYAVAMLRLDAATRYVAPDQKELLQWAGEEEASYNLWFGGGSSLVCLVGAGLVPAAAFTGRDPTRS